jgi:hypothetical protein
MNEELNSIMQRVYGKENHSHPAEVITVLFTTHNNLAKENGWPLEYSRSCGGCRQRVYARLRDLWLSLGGKLD